MLFNIIYYILKILLSRFKPKERDYISIILSLNQQLEVLQRKNTRLVKLSSMEKSKLAALYKVSRVVKDYLKIISPQPLTKWAKNRGRRICAKNKSYTKPAGRPPVSKEIKELILSMKNDNTGWGAGKIAGELLKVGIKLDESTIKRILRDFRRKGKIKKDPKDSWGQFLKNQATSLFATDFLTVDTIRGIRYFVIFFIKIKTREIVHFNVTTNPTNFFINQQLMALTWDTWPKDEKIYLIHDNDMLFKNIDFNNFCIENVPTSWRSPNMNAFAERFIRSLRNEALDHFIIFSQEQLRRIIKKYLEYYNKLRPHQGIGQDTPKGYVPQKPNEGKIVTKPMMFGLYNHYERKAS